MNSNKAKNNVELESATDKVKSISKEQVKKSDDDFLSGDNRAKFHPNLDEYEVTIKNQKEGNTTILDLIEAKDSEESLKKRNQSLRNGSHRNHL